MNDEFCGCLSAENRSPIRMAEQVKTCASVMPVWWLSGNAGKSRSPVNHCRKCQKKTASVFLTLVLGLLDTVETGTIVRRRWPQL
jgi:hypothetical protein